MKTEISLGSWFKPFKKVVLLFLLFFSTGFYSWSQHSNYLWIVKTEDVVRPLEEVILACSGEGIISVYDGKGREYFKCSASNKIAFTAGGAPGTHKITFSDRKGRVIETAGFSLEAETNVNDGGKFNELFGILSRGMMDEGRRGIFDINSSICLCPERGL